jgi:hypothetical protein
MYDGHDAKRSSRRWSASEPNQAPSGGRNGSRDDTSAKAQKNYESYVALARDAAARGDTIEVENCYQHAEHFLRVMKERAPQTLDPPIRTALERKPLRERAFVNPGYTAD